MAEKYLKHLDGKFVLDATGSKVPLDAWDKDGSDDVIPPSIEERIRTIRMLGQPVPPQLEAMLIDEKDSK